MNNSMIDEFLKELSIEEQGIFSTSYIDSITLSFKHLRNHFSSEIYFSSISVKNSKELRGVLQNIGHENMALTLSIYGQLDPHGIMDILAKIDSPSTKPDCWEKLLSELNYIKSRIPNLHE